MKRILPLFLLLLLAGCSSNAASIGIIGGADGPTAILVAGPRIAWYVWAAVIVMAAAVIWLLVRNRKKKK